MIQDSYLPTGSWDGDIAGPWPAVRSARDRARAARWEQRQLRRHAQEARTD
jgi:hypothetical protein